MKHKKKPTREALQKYYTSIYYTQHKKINAQIYIPFKLYKEEKKSFKNIELQKNNFTKSEQKTPTKKLFSKNT